MRQDRWMNAVFQIALEAPKVSEQKMAAIIVCKNSVISVGLNQMKTHPMVATYKVKEWAEYLHAESSAVINALRQINFRKLEKCELYVCRSKMINGIHTWGLAKPCTTCMEFLRHYPMKCCYYSTDEEGNYEKIEFKEKRY